VRTIASDLRQLDETGALRPDVGPYPLAAPAQTWMGDARRLALLLRLRPESSDLAPGTIGGSFAQP